MAKDHHQRHDDDDERGALCRLRLHAAEDTLENGRDCHKIKPEGNVRARIDPLRVQYVETYGDADETIPETSSSVLP